MLLDWPTPHFSQSAEPQMVYGYAGIRSEAIKNKVNVRRLDTPYSPRISSWMRRKIEGLVIAGEITNHAIAKQLGVSRGQVNYTSRRMFLRQRGGNPNHE